LLIFESALMCLCGVAAVRIWFGGEDSGAMITRQGWIKLLAAMIIAQIAFYLWMWLYRRLRRMFDIISSLIGIALSSPLMVLTAIAIRIESPGPVIYAQERVGMHGGAFRIFKFRSMRPDAEADGPVWACENDPRATRVGRIIRRLHIDEIPQFFNILRGEMSLIGPRPERPEFVKQFEERIPYYSERHLVKPGLTGWAQVRYPYGASLEDAVEKLQYDLYYIKNQSPLLDAIILLETARVVMFGHFSR
jgi:exopolysaccharide biosynthesis polyprenyl glycosylphosphotransferase